LYPRYSKRVENEKAVKKPKNQPKGFKKPSKRLTLYVVAMSIVICATGMVLYFYSGKEALFAEIKAVALLSILWPTALTDYKSYRIPNPFILLGLVYWAIISLIEVLAVGLDAVLPTLGIDLLMSVIVVALIFVVSLVVKGIGFGDIKLLFVMCLLLGMARIWGALFLTLIVAFIAAVVFLATKKKDKKDLMPFAPFILAGTSIALLLMGV
jgi:leader peptidase (prepilin peptidase)/N-methyltransferase